MALADEISSKERDMPLVDTGESVTICIKRGPLGACTKSIERTKANDNDGATKYFQRVATAKDPEEKEEEDQQAAMRGEVEVTGDDLLNRIRKEAANTNK
eukprot:CAMPEP_0116836154 /NCGR_PEP_ID=MMETSP0418-20121206/7937_1 /TAXON_ID=1158023 /ORGANISM="Astrosyne radiata, Strain 13vi08-1A" /LENGTH=99 /DNA_ID=CAMNT_0004465889 /DNA_START=237 /DNA_END=536 /DNA_ORIENTATION=+